MTIRILYVDDEPDIREVACLALELDPELEVRACGSGAEAIETAQVWQPQLILLDVMMPGLDGPATFERLKAIPSTAMIPTVFITARTQTRETDTFKQMGVAGVIAKPFDPMTLADTVRSFLPG